MLAVAWQAQDYLLRRPTHLALGIVATFVDLQQETIGQIAAKFWDKYNKSIVYSEQIKAHGKQ